MGREQRLNVQVHLHRTHLQFVVDDNSILDWMYIKISRLNFPLKIPGFIIHGQREEGCAAGKGPVLRVTENL